MAHSFARKTLCARVCTKDAEDANLCVHNFACRVFALVGKGWGRCADVLLYERTMAAGIRDGWRIACLAAADLQTWAAKLYT